MKGEQVFDALDTRWTMFLGNAAQCAVEEHYDKGFFAVVADAMPEPEAADLIELQQDPAFVSALQGSDPQGALLAALQRHPHIAAKLMRRLRVRTLTDLAWFGLRKHHPHITLDQVADIIDDLGQARFGEILGKAIQATQGEGGGADAAPGKSVTRKRKQTGPAS